MNNNIFVNRKGNCPNSYMTTIKLIKLLESGEIYKLNKDSLEKTNKYMYYPIISSRPESIIIKGEWYKQTCSDDSNILGGSGNFLCNEESIKLPVLKATSELLKYYNCKLIKHNDAFLFDSLKPVELTEIDIGKMYYDGYIKGKNKGIYLEYHDTAHFHMPLNKDCEGFLVIGKQINKTNYELTGFTIPYGYGVFMPADTIHNDIFLTGRYLVAYTKTNTYSTVILKNKQTNKLVDISTNYIL